MKQILVSHCDGCGLIVNQQTMNNCPRCNYPVNPDKEERFLESAIGDLQRVANYGGGNIRVAELLRRYQFRLNAVRHLNFFAYNIFHYQYFVFEVVVTAFYCGMMMATQLQEGIMELSLRLDTLGMVELRYLRGRERYRDWPPFLLLAASRQARVLAYMNREVVDQLHQQILAVEEAAGLGVEDEDEKEEENGEIEETGENESSRQAEREITPLSPAFAQALERLNDLARQRLPEAGISAEITNEELSENEIVLGDEEDALEQLQDAFVQMMEVVRELAEELSTDALKLTGRFRCARIEVFFTQSEPDEDDEDDEDKETAEELGVEDSLLEVELALVLRLYEEGHAKPDDLPAVELQLDVDDFERLHETLDFAIDRERRSSRRRR